MMLVDHGGIELIDRDGCLRLLQQGEVGRVAIVSGGQPLILPVNYALDGETVVFRTGPGLKRDVGPRSPACFEIDSFDMESRSGWSVLVLGPLEEVRNYDASRFSHVRDLDVRPWAPGERSHWMQLAPRSITGRRVGGSQERAAS